MLISKNDIKQLAQFTLNIEDRIINPNIEDATEYDLRPVVGDVMTDKFLTDFDSQNLQPWDVATAYSLNDFVIYQSKVYKATAPSTGLTPDTSPGVWAINELGSFFYKYVRPYIVFNSYQRFLLWVGRNITQYGLREINEETSNPVAEEGRAQLIADIRTKSKIWLFRMNNELCQKDWTFDSIKYEVDCEDYKLNPRPTFKIRYIK